MKKAILTLFVVGALALVGCGSTTEPDTIEFSGDLNDRIQTEIGDAVEEINEQAEDLEESVLPDSNELLDNTSNYFEENNLQSVLVLAQENADSVHSDLGLADMATLEITDEDESTIAYEITLISDGIEIDEEELGMRIMQADEEFQETLDEMDERGIDNPRVLVVIFNEEGNQVFQKEYLLP